mgnify:CR=1 FL=1
MYSPLRKVPALFIQTQLDGSGAKNLIVKNGAAKYPDVLGKNVFENGEFFKIQFPKTQLLGRPLIHISEPTRLLSISYAVFCLKKKKKNTNKKTKKKQQQKQQHTTDNQQQQDAHSQHNTRI